MKLVSTTVIYLAGIGFAGAAPFESNSSLNADYATKQAQQLEDQRFKDIVDRFNARQRAEYDRAKKEAVTARPATVKEVETDQPSFVGRPFLCAGKIEVSSYYNYGYRDSELTHFAFEFTDTKGNSASVYMRRSEGAALRAKILEHGAAIPIECALVIMRGLYEPSPSLFAEIVEVRSPNLSDKATSAVNPSEEAQKAAVAKYPELKVAGSPLHMRFLARVAEIRASNPQYFNSTDWPMRLAEELAKE